MFIFKDLYLVLLFFAAILPSIFISRKIIVFLNKKFISLYNKQIIISFFNGVFFGFIFLLMQSWIYEIDNSFVLPLFIIGQISLVFIQKNIDIFISTIAPIIYYIFSFGTSEYLYISLFLWVFILGIAIWLKQKEASFKRGLIMLSLILTITTIIFIFSKFILVDANNEIIIEFSLVLVFLIIFHYILVYFFLKLIKNYEELDKIITFQFSHYYKNNIYKSKIKDMIFKEKIKYGIIFGIRFLSNVSNEQRQKFLKEIEFFLHISNSIGFNLDLNTWGFFIPFNKNQNFSLKETLKGNDLEYRVNKDDPLFFIENFINHKSKHIKKNDMKFVSTFYGIDDSSFSMLEKNISFAFLTAKESRNIINVFSYQKYLKRNYENKMLKDLDETIILDNFEINYFPIINLKKQKIEFVLAKYSNKLSSYFSHSTREYIDSYDWLETFDKYFALRVLKDYKQFNKYKIAFRYSAIFSERINAKYLVEKIKSLDIRLDNFYIFIDKLIIFDHKIFLDNFISLQKLGFQFILKNSSLLKEIPKLKPTDFEYIIIKRKDFDIKNNENKKVYDIPNFVIKEDLKENNINLFYGKKVFYTNELGKINNEIFFNIVK